MNKENYRVFVEIGIIIVKIAFLIKLNMKKLFRSIKLITAVAFTLFFTSCMKEGPQGAQGPRGYSGVVNVDAYSLTVNLADLLYSSTTAEYYINENISTANIVSTDAVLVYYNRETYQGNDYWAQMPFDDYYSSTRYNHFSYELGYNGYMMLNIRNSDGVAPYSPMTTGSLFFRIIVIRGNSKKATIPSTIDTKNYLEVKKFYNLK